MEEKDRSYNTIASSQVSLFDSLYLSDLPKRDFLKCAANNKAIQMCLNSKCKQVNVFQCSEQNCKCQYIHDSCHKGNSRRVIKMVNSKILDIEPYIQSIDQLIDRKIDELSELRQNLIKTVQEEFKYMELNVLEKKFLGLVNGEVLIQDFSSVESKLIWQSSSQQPQIKKIETEKQIYFCLQKFDQCITNCVQELKTKINIIIEEKKKQHERSALKPQILTRSAICTTDQLAQNFIKIFGNKITKLSYLLCASQNEFSLQKYFQVSGKVQNTVMICKTNMDKIIGGYTPLAFDLQNNNTFIEDASGKSFIFSLTDMEKFSLKDKKGAICRRTYKDFIVFGKNQLVICDKSNTSKNCWSCINKSSYQCPAYPNNDRVDWLKFNGNQSLNFSTKEWEVWKVEF